ncbi:MAG: DEAD/DEAH box helicase [Nitrospirae bacterium]|nr:DEAD/DEAH box helicase [Nitrospirota bacterium]
MTPEELRNLLHDQPVRRLHDLAQGRITHHFRMGKYRLIKALLSLPVEDRAAVAANLGSLAHRISLGSGSSQKPRLAGAYSDRTIPSPKPAPEAKPISEPATSVAALFEGIGVPPAEPFNPDDWQIEAIASLTTRDVIVSVPTGSGKTYVAIEATRQAIEADRTVIYTSPLKALSNTKLTEFSQIFGSDRVGILTGDRRDNPYAPVLIMTTEILRNLLYDAASGEIDIRLDTLGLVILDESQYLADPERGVVWEETIIFCPSQARLLLLSASIGNPEELATWISRIRPTPCHLIHHRNRSVPLRAGYLHPTGKLTPLFKTRDIPKGRPYALHPETKRLFAQYEEETLGPRYRH